jgi:pimeloyl-ACP methyl ester carboxylesterase
MQEKPKNMQIIIPVMLIIVFIGAAILVEASIARSDLQRNPPPGRMVDVGGHLLHINCSGAGTPLVVFDAGLGDSNLVWATVQEQLAATTRVCSYDRAGVGWSEPGPKPRTFLRAAEELHTLLANTGEIGPFVLVGHSAGVNTIRLFAQTYPEQVAGLVLIEPPILGEVNPILLSGIHAMRLALGGLSRTGGIRLLGKLSLMKLLFGGAAPPAALSERAGYLYRPESIQASVDEIEALPETICFLERSVFPGAWRDWPIVIISAYREATPQIEAGDPLESLARLSTKGEVLRVKGTHFVHFEHPEMVVETISRIVAVTQQRNNSNGTDG